MSERYRLKQDGMPVAWAEGPGAELEILHYAAVYQQDGPAIVEKHDGRRWKAWPPKGRP